MSPWVENYNSLLSGLLTSTQPFQHITNGLKFFLRQGKSKDAILCIKPYNGWKSLKWPKNLAHIKFSNFALNPLHTLSQTILFLPLPCSRASADTLPSTWKALPFHFSFHLANVNPSFRPKFKFTFLGKLSLTLQTRIRSSYFMLV